MHDNPDSNYMPKISRPTETAFARDVRKGLTDNPKHLPSRYIYDKRGDALFQQIMQLPEDYLTDCETEIFKEHKAAIARRFRASGQAFNLIELGAGDGRKTRILLEELLRHETLFRYMPIDISGNALRDLCEGLGQEFEDLRVDPWEGTYFEMLQEIHRLEQGPKVILFLGSNIGNLLHPQAVQFLDGLESVMEPGDLLFIGFDQKKDPATVLEAYNDPGGVTEAFNKNLLRRINREFGADFQPEKFLHWETYDPESGTAKSYLVARQAMQVRIPALQLEVSFRPWETIHTEISQKYDEPIIRWLADETGLQIVEGFSDSRDYYKNYILQKKQS